MIKITKSVWVFALLLGASLNSAAETQFNWTLEKEDKDRKIKVFLSEVKGSKLKAFRGEADLDAPMWKVLSLIEDQEAGPKWLHETSEVRIIEHTSDRSSVAYSVSEVPWPLKDRDLVVETTAYVNPAKDVVTLVLKGMKDRLPKKDKYVRVPYLDGKWIVSKIDEQHSHIVYQIHTLPGGSVPSWLANSFVVDNPYYSLKNMQKLLKTGDYEQKMPGYLK